MGEEGGSDGGKEGGKIVICTHYVIVGSDQVQILIWTLDS